MIAHKTVQLDELCEIQSGGTPSRSNPDFYGGNIPWAIIADMKTTNGFVCKTKNQITDAGLKAIRGRIFPKGTILLAMYGSVGKTAVAGTLLSTNQAILGIQIKNESLLNSKYLHYWFNQQQPNLVKMARGVTQKNISATIVRNLKIPLPSLEEQKRIAEILDKADELRRKRRESITALDSLTQSIFLDLFGDPVTNPLGFKKTDLDSQLDFLTSGSRGWAKYYSNEGSLFLRIQNVCNGCLQLDDVAYVNAPDTAEAKRTLVQTGDVLLSITADLGRTAVVPSDIGRAHINQHLAILRSSSIDPTYLAQLLLTDAGKRQFGMLNKSAVKAGLTFSDIRSVKILLPPKELQEEFAKRCDAIETQRTKLLAAQEETENLFTSLQQKSFTEGL